MKILGVIVLSLGCCINQASSDEKQPIGKITSLGQKEFYPIEILENGSAKRAACSNCPVYENDVITTRRSQHINLELSDGSELAIGPDSQVTIENWTHRNSDGFLKRVVFITIGAMRATVKRVYSEDEPFLVKTKNSIMAVRGTRFITLLERERVDKFNFKTTVDLFTLEGEVHFAHSEKDLHSDNFVIVLPHHRSTFYENNAIPTAPRKFEVAELRQSIIKALPQAATQIVMQKYSYQAKEESIRGVISPQSKKTTVNTPPGFTPRVLHSGHQDENNDQSFASALSQAEAAKARRKAKEQEVLLQSDEEKDKEKEEQEKTNAHEAEAAERQKKPGYGPGPNGLSTFRSNNPTSPFKLQQGQPRPQTNPELRRSTIR